MDRRTGRIRALPQGNAAEPRGRLPESPVRGSRAGARRRPVRRLTPVGGAFAAVPAALLLRR
jgi:hypothetical protein